MLAGLALAACATQTFPATLYGVPVGEEPAPSSVDETRQAIAAVGNVVLVREYAEPTAWPVTLILDGNEIGTLGQKQYRVLNLTPGDHVLKTRWPVISGQVGNELTFTVTEDGPLYIALLGTSEAFGGGSGITEFRMGSGFQRLDADTAPAALTWCCTLRE